jgi:N-dimethylarginine dimethylaminohydrolase
MSRNGKTEPEFTPGAVRVVEDLGMTVADVERLGFRVVEHWSGVPAVAEKDAYAISKRQAMISQQREDERRRFEAEQERKMAEFAARYAVAPRGVPAVEGLSAVEQVLLAGEGDRPRTVFTELLDAELAGGKGA